MAHFDMSGNLVHDVFVLGHFRLCLQDGLSHLQHRLDGCDGSRDTAQRGEGACYAAVRGAESIIGALAHTGLHRQIVQHDRTGQRDRSRDEAVEFDECRRIVFQLRVLCVQAPPAGEYAFLRSGQADLLHAVEHRVAHACFLSA